MPNAIVYIDGFNLFHGLEDAGLRQFYWLNLYTMATKLGAHWGYDVPAVRYFTSRVPHSFASRKQQELWLRAVKTQTEVLTTFGDFVPRNCKMCNGQFYTEKGTDVSLAVWILYDYIKRMHMPAKPEAAILVTGDSDLAPAIRRLRDIDSTYPVMVAFPPLRVSGELEKYAGQKNCIAIDDELLEGCCMPDEISPTLRKPHTWA